MFTGMLALFHLGNEYAGQRECVGSGGEVVIMMVMMVRRRNKKR